MRRNQRLRRRLLGSYSHHAGAPRRKDADTARDEPCSWQTLEWIAQVIASRGFDGNGRREEILECRAGSTGRSVRFAEPAAEPERSDRARPVERDATNDVGIPGPEEPRRFSGE